jgi:hypothetical protein
MNPQFTSALPELAGDVFSNFDMDISHGTWLIRRELAQQNSPQTIAEVINFPGLLDRLIELINKGGTMEIQSEATSAVVNLVQEGTTEQTRYVINHGAIEAFVQLLKSPHHHHHQQQQQNNVELDEAMEHAIFALGTIASTSINYRDHVLSVGVIPNIIYFICNKTNKMAYLRTNVWLIANLLRGQPPPRLDQILPIPQVLSIMLLCNDGDLLSDACWSCVHIAKMGCDGIDSLLYAGIIKTIFCLVRDFKHTQNVLSPAIALLLRISQHGTPGQVQRMIDQGLFDVMSDFFTKYSSTAQISTLGDACRIVQRLMKLGPNKVQAAIDCGLITALQDTTPHENNSDLITRSQHASTVALAYAIIYGTTVQRRMVAPLNKRVFIQICEALRKTDYDQDEIKILLGAIEIMLNIGYWDASVLLTEGTTTNFYIDLAGKNLIKSCLVGWLKHPDTSDLVRKIVAGYGLSSVVVVTTTTTTTTTSTNSGKVSNITASNMLMVPTQIPDAVSSNEEPKWYVENLSSVYNMDGEFLDSVDALQKKLGELGLLDAGLMVNVPSAQSKVAKILA